MLDTSSNSGGFVFYLEDLDCEYCLYAQHKTKMHKNACREESCRYEHLRQEAIDNGRLIRKEGITHNETDSKNMEGGTNS